MMYPDVRAGNPGDTPWDARRPVDGQDGYYWHYHSPGSDVRVVCRRGEDRDVAAGTVRPNPEWTPPDLSNAVIAYDTDGEWIATGPRPVLLVRWVALHDRAARLGAQRAVTELAATVADSEMDTEDWARCLEDDGHHEVWWNDFGRPRDPQSGKDGDPSEDELLRELGGGHPDRDTDPDGDLPVSLGARYTAAFNVAWHDEAIRIAHERLGST